MGPARGGQADQPAAAAAARRGVVVSGWANTQPAVYWTGHGSGGPGFDRGFAGDHCLVTQDLPRDIRPELFAGDRRPAATGFALDDRTQLSRDGPTTADHLAHELGRALDGRCKGCG